MTRTIGGAARNVVFLVVATVVAGALPGCAESGLDRGGTPARDVSGVWMRQEPGATFSDSPPPVMTAWAAQRFVQNKATVGPSAALDANDPTIACYPPGVPYILAVPVPFELIQAPGRVLQLFEYNHNVRQIHTDGRPHPDDLRDTERAQWMGHSIGRWDSDTFVIDTVGFNDQTWLDRLGHPHSAQLHVVERLRRLGSAAVSESSKCPRT